MMRSRLAARLVLATATVTALAAITTACGPEDTTDTGSSGSSGSSSAPSADGGSETPSTSGTKSSGSDSSGSSDKNGSGDSADKSGYGQSCGTNDLEFTVTAESQAGGYYLVTAKAKSGITCYLDVNTPSVAFGSGTDGVASPVGQGGEEPLKLTGSAVAYTGINPKTTDTEGGKEFENVIIATREDDPDPAELALPDTATVDKPIVTNWSTDRNETVPRII